MINSAGGTDVYSQAYSYFFEEYADGLALNLLSPVIQTVTSSQPSGAAAQIVSKVCTTWCDWSSGQGAWAPSCNYQALNAGATFNSWSGGQPSSTDFVLVSQITARSGDGAVLSECDALLTPQSTTYDTSGFYVVSTACNSSIGQAIWYGCEPYESSEPWTTNDPGETVDSYLTTDDFHTGTQCLALPSNSPNTGPMLLVTPVDQTRRYLFSCWARTSPDATC